MTRLINRLLFRKDDPLRELRVPRKDRLVEDEILGWGNTDFAVDRDEVRNRGGVVGPEDLE